MSASYSFVLVDVFTERPLAGNQLDVSPRRQAEWGNVANVLEY